MKKEKEVEEPIVVKIDYNHFIKSLIDRNKVLIFGKDYCPFTTYCEEVLKNKGVEYKLINLDQENIFAGKLASPHNFTWAMQDYSC